MDAPHTLLSERYRLVRVIAAGGMGVVWEGWDELLERPVAVKQLRTQPGVSDEEAETAKNRAMREARIAARLHHPNAVPVFDAVEQDGQPCLVMQYVPSTPLSALLHDDGPLPPREAARIGAQVASALAAAHRLGIVHRDIKPGNVLLDEDGRALISDFGISRALGDTTLTSTGLVHGTPAYLAPEVARGDDSSFASDVFSLGSTLYAAVEGAPPFGADANSIAVLHRVAMGDFAPPRHAGALTPLLLDMLAAEPGRRPPMSQVAARLDQLRNSAESEPTTRLRPGRDTEPDETAAWDEESRPTAVLPVAAAAVAAAAVPPTEPEPSAEVDQDADEEPDPDPEALADEPEPEPEPGDALQQAEVLEPGPESEPGDEAGPEAEEDESAPTPVPLAVEEPTGAPEPTPRTPVLGVPAPPEPAVAVPLDAPGDEAPVEDRPRRTGLIAVLVVVILLVLAALIAGGVLLASSHGTAPATSAPPAHSTAPSSPAPTSAGPSLSPSPTAASPSPSPSPTPTATAAPSPSPTATSAPVSGTPTSGQLAGALRNYFALLPGNTDAAWNRLTPSFQQGHAQGRAYFDSFWGGYRSVTVSAVQGEAPDRASATLTYVADDGTRTVEHDTFRLVRQGGVLKIDDQHTG
ncbi:serine/threonine-protein kinase [Amnibacterium sp.]|uniref:serine/threonine-protein kinase n=1 Tax=Amnibacterium sp. TaxID=1872496 RepID=UPI00262E06BE|nr:serine/threonine-protein kinase [Amnibacterium sp.]MCU1474443.1 putative serine/threonine protein kinase [Amnibacterium sp.]